MFKLKFFIRFSEQPEKCPWADRPKRTKIDHVTPLEIIDDIACLEPSTKRLCPIKLGKILAVAFCPTMDRPDFCIFRIYSERR